MDGDDNEPAGWAKLDDCFSTAAGEREPTNEELDFTGLRVALAIMSFGTVGFYSAGRHQIAVGR